MNKISSENLQGVNVEDIAQEDIIKLWLKEDFQIFDPQYVIANDFWLLFNVCYEGLVRQEQNGIVRKGSGLAKDWTISENKKVYVFTLKEGLKWSDGKPLTAKDFEFGCRRAVDPRNNLRPWQMYIIQGAEEVHKLNKDNINKIEEGFKDLGMVALDDKKLQITLKEPAPYFLNLLALPIFMPIREDAPPVENVQDIVNNVYNGPFIIEEYSPNAYVRLIKNNQYHDKVSYNHLHFNIGGSSVQKYNDSLVDTISMPSSNIEIIPKKDLSFSDEAVTLYIACNTQMELTNNKKFRKALSMVLDRKKIAEASVIGSTPATGLVPKAICGGRFRELSGDLCVKYESFSEAKRLIKDMYNDLNETNEIKLMCGDEPANIQEAKEVAKAIKDTLGITVKIQIEGLTSRFNKVKCGDYQLAILAWRADYDDPLSFLSEHVSNGAAGNQSKWTNETYNSLIEKGRRSQSLTKRDEYLIEAEQLLIDEAVIIPLCFRSCVWAKKSELKNVIHVPTGPSPELRWAYKEVID